MRDSRSPRGGRSARPRVLPESLHQELERAGYYPDLVADTVAAALGGESVQAHLVHLETTFDSEEVRRHVTVLALTPTRLVIAHADDHGADAHNPLPYASASTESVALHRVSSVVAAHLVTSPERYRAGDGAREMTLTVTWGAVSRIDLEPADCGDPECTADHGYTGTMTGDDITVRVSAEAEGSGAVAAADRFAAALSQATVVAGGGWAAGGAPVAGRAGEAGR